MKRNIVVAALGTTQALAWGSSYYLPAILAEPIAEGLGLSRAMVFGVFSGSLLLSAFLGPTVGRAIDNRGGRGVLVLSNVVLAAGLVLLALVQGVIGLATAWAVLGVGMALGLYDSAFATLTGLYGRAARGPITGITLIAGFASTIGWPLSAFLDASMGWRGTCLAWAALNLLVCLPLNRLLIPRAPPPEHAIEPEGSATVSPRGAMPILAFVFAATWFVTGAMAAHLPRLLEIAGASSTAAIAAAALVGPAQVAARLVEFGVLRWIHPLVSARIATVLHPVGAGILAAFGAPAIMAFALFHGAGNGLLTIAKGTLPLAIFGPVGYGLRTGILAAPARAAQAASPLIFGLLIDWLGVGALTISAGMSIAALIALMGLRARTAPAGVPSRA
ncbi:MAG TPA: MFS transporter [Stellaceae bacterium]|nr:MFS transporter [Stellaceae bacterium]